MLRVPTQTAGHRRGGCQTQRNSPKAAPPPSPGRASDAIKTPTTSDFLTTMTTLRAVSELSMPRLRDVRPRQAKSCSRCFAVLGRVIRRVVGAAVISSMGVIAKAMGSCDCRHNDAPRRLCVRSRRATAQFGWRPRLREIPGWTSHVDRAHPCPHHCDTTGAPGEPRPPTRPLDRSIEQATTCLDAKAGRTATPVGGTAAVGDRLGTQRAARTGTT